MHVRSTLDAPKPVLDQCLLKIPDILGTTLKSLSRAVKPAHRILNGPAKNEWIKLDLKVYLNKEFQLDSIFLGENTSLVSNY